MAQCQVLFSGFYFGGRVGDFERLPMPCRMIREGLICSERVNQLDAQGERFFVRLMLKADDFGCFTAHPALLKAALFPLRDDVRSTDIPRLLAACEKAGLVRCYSADGKEYVEVLNFDQRLRAKKRRYPPPPEHDWQKTDICQTDDGHMTARRETEIEEEKEVETEHEEKRNGASLVFPENLSSERFKAKFSEWQAYRKKLKKPGDWHALFQRQLNKAAEYGEAEAIARLDRAMTNGWTGFDYGSPAQQQRPQPTARNYSSL